MNVFWHRCFYPVSQFPQSVKRYVLYIRHLLNMENKGYSNALGSFLMGGNGNFTGYLDASNSVAVNRSFHGFSSHIGWGSNKTSLLGNES